MISDQVKHMVDRFLGWRLPENFNPDGGIRFERMHYNDHLHPMPTGTNLFDASQAEEMVRYMLDSGIPTKPVAETSEAPRTHESLEWGTNCPQAADRGPHECNGRCVPPQHTCLRCGAFCLCQWCNDGNSRTESSVSNRLVHTDTPIGRVNCVDEPHWPPEPAVPAPAPQVNYLSEQQHTECTGTCTVCGAVFAPGEKCASCGEAAPEPSSKKKVLAVYPAAYAVHARVGCYISSAPNRSHISNWSLSTYAYGDSQFESENERLAWDDAASNLAAPALPESAPKDGKFHHPQQAEGGDWTVNLESDRDPWLFLREIAKSNTRVGIEGATLLALFSDYDIVCERLAEAEKSCRQLAAGVVRYKEDRYK